MVGIAWKMCHSELFPWIFIGWTLFRSLKNNMTVERDGVREVRSILPRGNYFFSRLRTSTLGSKKSWKFETETLKNLNTLWAVNYNEVLYIYFYDENITGENYLWLHENV